jgi:hypothetical protein
MACLLLRGPQGDRSIKPNLDGKTYTYSLLPGEKIAGMDNECNGQLALKEKPVKVKDLIQELDEEIGAGVGNWIKVFAAPVAKLVGKQGCTSCEVRRVITNAYARLKAKHGQAEALKIMGELWSLTLNKPEIALEKLKEYLDA